MKHKKLLTCLTIVTLSLSLLATPCFVLTSAFAFAPVFRDTFVGELKEKVELLKNAEKKKIVVIGGSSVPFGIQSNYIKKYLPNYDVVNFGLYAALGSDVMLDLAREYIDKDDIIIFSPEMNTQTLSFYYNGRTLWQALDGNFSCFHSLSKETKERMLGDLYTFAQEKAHYTLFEELKLEGVYQRSSFNEYGDIKPELLPYNIMQDLYDPTTTIDLENTYPSADFLSYLNDYAMEAKKKGASFYYRFAPMNEKSIISEITMDSYYEKLNEDLSFPILGNPNDAVMEAEWFYDSNFHLNGAGSILNTKNLIKDIKIVLNDHTITDIYVPEKPQIQGEDETLGDCSDEDCFLYQEDGEGYQIIGVKEKKESLIIPTHHDGKRVKSFSAKTFQNQSGILEILIQSNIESLYDYSFKDNTELTKIKIKNKKPYRIKIGSHLLDDSKAKIYVPKDVLSLYKSDYNFSQYADRIFADPTLD